MKTIVLIIFSFSWIISLATLAQTGIIDYLRQTPPGDTPVFFAPGIISTDTLEHSAPALAMMEKKYIGQLSEFSTTQFFRM